MELIPFGDRAGSLREKGLPERSRMIRKTGDEEEVDQVMDGEGKEEPGRGRTILSHNGRGLERPGETWRERASEPELCRGSAVRWL